MSTDQQPTAAAVRAARQIVPNGTEGTITAALQVMQAAAIIDAEIRPLVTALEAGMRTADFERHPFRPWHAQARAALTHAQGKP